jgi:hypothetical protein
MHCGHSSVSDEVDDPQAHLRCNNDRDRFELLEDCGFETWI